MHELSIAINIVDIAARETEQAGANRVTDIDIEVGALSGVVIEALEFAMEDVRKNSVLEGARVTITEINPKARCRQCDKIFEVNDLFDICPFCQSVDLEIIRGQELQVKSLKVQ